MNNFYEAINDLKRNAGNPSLRSIGRAIGCSHSSVSKVFSSSDAISWEISRLVISHLGGDENEFQELWHERLKLKTMSAQNNSDDSPQRTLSIAPVSPSIIIIYVIAALIFIFASVASGVGNIPIRIRYFLVDIFQIIFGTTATFIFLKNYYKDKVGFKWDIFLTLAMGFWTAGQILWTLLRLIYDENAPEGVSDILYLMFPVFFIVYFIGSVRSIGMSIKHIEVMVFDIIFFLICLSPILIIIQGMDFTGKLIAWNFITTYLYVLTDIGMIMMILILYRLGGKGGSLFFVFLFLAVFSLLFSDSAFANSIISAIPVTPIQDIGFMFATLSFFLAAVSNTYLKNTINRGYVDPVGRIFLTMLIVLVIVDCFLYINEERFRTCIFFHLMILIALALFKQFDSKRGRNVRE